MSKVDLHRGVPATPVAGATPVTEVLRWPLDAAARPALREAGRPCLWLLEDGELVPELDDLEDWVRLPVDPGALHARTERLESRALVAGRLAPGDVRVDADGLLSFGPGRVVVPRIEAAILNRLGASPERVVRRADLVELVWPGRTPTVRALDSRIHTLRARVAPLGLHVHTIRAQGFLLALRARSPAPTRLPSPTPPGDLPRSYRWSN